MVEKRYEWEAGAILEDHSKRKHKILREYFFRYLLVRCQLPQQARFRLAVIDGFAGGGRYRCGAAGSPLIFIEELSRATQTINLQRAAQGMATIEVECFLVLNDASRDALESLKSHVAPVLQEAKSAAPQLYLKVEYLGDTFEGAYSRIKAVLQQGRYRNVVFNLDQCGHSHVERSTILDIMRTYPSAEIFYTFMIQSLITFLSRTDPKLLASQLAPVGLDSTDLRALDGVMHRDTWLGAAERIVFEAFRRCALFVSPFSINNPEGWRYWLIHFANSYRARQVYNNVLHDNSSAQAHFGRPGLHMLSYDPTEDRGGLYLFDMAGRGAATQQLLEDIPRLIADLGDAMPIGEFYESIYNATPAHADDIHRAIIDSPDIEVVTPSGGERRKANTISLQDILKLKRQRFFPQFLNVPRLVNGEEKTAAKKPSD
jgi:three-Cys-motif partner protein